MPEVAKPNLQIVTVEPVATPSWEKLRLEYFNENLDFNRSAPFTLKMLAERYGISYGNLRNIAASQTWTEELEELQHQKRTAVTKELVRLKIQDEVTIRARQVTDAAILQSVAMRRFAMVTDDDIKRLKLRDASVIFRIGAQEERKAGGLEDHYTPPKDDAQDAQVKHAISTALEVIGRFRQQRALELEGSNGLPNT